MVGLILNDNEIIPFIFHTKINIKMITTYVKIGHFKIFDFEMSYFNLEIWHLPYLYYMMW